MPDSTTEPNWDGRNRPIKGSELRLELSMTVAFLLAAGALAVVAQPTTEIHPLAGVLVIAYAIAARVEFPIAGGSFTPTELTLIPLFVLAPAEYVPLLVFAGFVLAALSASVTRAQPLDRVVFSAGDSFHALGPALVITAVAAGDATHASALALVAAFAAQVVADFASASVHELLSLKAGPREHIRMMFRVWGVDAALATVGALAAWQAVETPLAALATLPLVLLLGRLAADRMHRIDAARERALALELERGRRQAAIDLLHRQVGFLQDVSHELRTPVTIARGHIDNAHRTSGRPEGLGVALDELGRIDRMIERLLMMARAEEPERLQRRPLDAVVHLEERFVRWSDTVPRPWRLGELAPGTLNADADALNAVLDALLENAVKHTTRTQAIELRSRDDHGTLTIEVSDAGSGIPADALGRIFDRFGRAEPRQASHDGGAGLGLGLALVDAVARAHGGRCSVESSPSGSRFSLSLPGFAPSLMPTMHAPSSRVSRAASASAGAERRRVDVEVEASWVVADLPHQSRVGGDAARVS